MTRTHRVAELQAELHKALTHMEKSRSFHARFRADFPADTPTEPNYDLVILADIVSDYYTCLETAFVRISKFFENHLEPDRWHRHLLEKMMLDIPGVRIAVLSDTTYGLLSEFLRFRHFRRYYYDYNYDRDKMAFLEKKYLESLPLVTDDLQRFLRFLSDIAGA